MITTQIIQIVNEAIEFQNSELCERALRGAGAPPHNWKWVKIDGHRRNGYSTAALMLLELYTSSLIVYPNHNSAAHARRQALDESLVPSLSHVLSCNYHPESSEQAWQSVLKSEQAMDWKWFRGLKPNQRHQLIILDQASRIEYQRDKRDGGMDKFRDELFMFCDLLVELG